MGAPCVACKSVWTAEHTLRYCLDVFDSEDVAPGPHALMPVGAHNIWLLFFSHLAWASLTNSVSSSSLISLLFAFLGLDFELYFLLLN